LVSDNKITVDELLVSTDVDGLIRTIAERRKLPMSELQQLCRIDKKNFDKWVRVLEDEGYISIEYGLRGTNIIWKGKEEYGSVPAQMPADARTSTPLNPVSVPAKLEPAKVPEKPVEVKPELVKAPQKPAEAPEAQEKEPAPEEAEPEELLSQYLARKREGSGVSFRETATDTSTTKTGTGDEFDVFSVKEISTEQESTGTAPEPVETEAMEDESEAADEEDVEAEPEPIVQPEPARREPIRKPVTSVDTRELVNAYMDEINREKAKIESLKKDKDRLYRDKFAVVEGKLEADVVTLTEVILDKQSRIAELKERVLELPDKVDELEKLQEQLNRLQEEGRGALDRTGQKVDSFLRSMEDSKGEISGKVESLNTIIGKESDKVRELERIKTSVDARLSKLQSATEAVKLQIDELNSAMAELRDDVAQTADMRAEVEVLSVSLRETVAKHGGDLDSLESELAGIDRIEHWVKEYIEDYEKKIEGVEQYVGRSQDELAELKESAETLYMNKYLGELSDITDEYQSELGDAVTKEQDIEEKIAASKSRISDLIKDSQEMIRKLRSEPAPARDFGSMTALVKARTEKIKATIDEKEKERLKLVEDSRNVRKTRVVSTVSGSRSAPVSRSASRFVSRSVPKKKKK
jgi:methyl-accepting chemotaxis protein